MLEPIFPALLCEIVTGSKDVDRYRMKAHKIKASSLCLPKHITEHEEAFQRGLVCCVKAGGAGEEADDNEDEGMEVEQRENEWNHQRQEDNTKKREHREIPLPSSTRLIGNPADVKRKVNEQTRCLAMPQVLRGAERERNI